MLRSAFGALRESRGHTFVRSKPDGCFMHAAEVSKGRARRRRTVPRSRKAPRGVPIRARRDACNRRALRVQRLACTSELTNSAQEGKPWARSKPKAQIGRAHV